MKKLKITFLVLYIIAIIALLYEAFIPGDLSIKQNKFFKKIINNISKTFIKEKIIKAEEIVINNSFKEYYYTNETLTLDVTVNPSNSSYKGLDFASSDENILTINSSGEIKFIGEGEAFITVSQCESAIIEIINFKVKKYVEPVIEPIEPEAIELHSNSGLNTIAVGDVLGFYLLFDKDGVNDINYTLTSSNEEVCGIYGSYVYGLKEGTTTITATHHTTQLTSSMDITITPGEIVKPEYFRIKGDNEVVVGDKTKHIYTVEVDPNASDVYKLYFFSAYDINGNKTAEMPLDVTWYSGELEIITSGVGAIFAYCVNWIESDYMMVTARNILPEFYLYNRRVVLGKSYNITINPTNKDKVTYSKFEYSSSDESIASVDGNGVITPHKTGQTEITVLVNDGFESYSDSFILTVDNKDIEDSLGYKSFTKLVRKGIAHFLGFLAFGVIAFIMFFMWIKPNYDGSSKYIWLLIGINGLSFAVLTEVIQLFVPGRGPTITDVFIDYLGYTISFVVCIIVLLIIELVKKHKNKNENINS